MASQTRSPLQVALIALLISVILSLGAASAADEPRWVEAGGEAFLGETESQTEVIKRARRAAELAAIEQAIGSFINSHTLVSNSQVADDLIYASVRGRAEKIEVISEGWDEKDRTRYFINIKALIAPVYQNKEEGLKVNANLSRAELRESDEVKLYYKTNADCYVYIFSLAADGSVTLLVPSTFVSDNRALAGKVYEFPAEGSRLYLRAMFLPGFTGAEAREKIKVIATRKQEELIPLGFREGSFSVYDSKSTGMITDLVKRLNTIEPADWTEATVEYVISR
ncbi:MAG: DUF4384 domain-containing protein [Deltaproteobacteria bacterium]